MLAIEKKIVGHEAVWISAEARTFPLLVAVPQILLL